MPNDSQVLYIRSITVIALNAVNGKVLVIGCCYKFVIEDGSIAFMNMIHEMHIFTPKKGLGKCS